MSRSGYSDGCEIDNWQLIKWRGMIASATRGRRGQQFFRDLLSALDSMPAKELIANELQDAEGNVCAIGSLGAKRGVDLSKIDPEDYEAVSAAFDIAECLAREIEFMNDEWGEAFETPAQRWKRMRAWVAKQIREAE